MSIVFGLLVLLLIYYINKTKDDKHTQRLIHLQNKKEKDVLNYNLMKKEEEIKIQKIVNEIFKKETSIQYYRFRLKEKVTSYSGKFTLEPEYEYWYTTSINSGDKDYKKYISIIEKPFPDRMLEIRCEIHDFINNKFPESTLQLREYKEMEVSEIINKYIEMIDKLKSE